MDVSVDVTSVCRVDVCLSVDVGTCCCGDEVCAASVTQREWYEYLLLWRWGVAEVGNVELRLFAREVIDADHWFVDGKVPFCVKTFISSSQLVFCVLLLNGSCCACEFREEEDCVSGELRLFPRAVIRVEHWIVDGKVPLGVKTFISSSQLAFCVVFLNAGILCFCMLVDILSVWISTEVRGVMYWVGQGKVGVWAA
ncbi:hypothetical protein, conserved, partial [Eimeria maxima]